MSLKAVRSDDTYWESKSYAQIIDEMKNDMKEIIALMFHLHKSITCSMDDMIAVCIRKWKKEWAVAAIVPRLLKIEAEFFNDEKKSDEVVHYWNMESEERQKALDDIIIFH